MLIVMFINSTPALIGRKHLFLRGLSILLQSRVHHGTIITRRLEIAKYRKR